MVSLPDIPSDSALARLFYEERGHGEATWFSLPGGATLFQAGEPADHLYFLRAGRLGAFRKEENGEPQFLGVIRPGEPAGEMSLIAGAPHSGSVVALRDSEIFALPRDAFFEAAEADASVMTELARLMILRSRQAATKTSVGEPSVYGFVATGAPVPVRPLLDKVAREIGRLGFSVTVVGSEAQSAPTEWFSEVERDYDFVLYAAEADDIGWRQVVGRQVDRLFRVARGDAAPPPEGLAHAEPLQVQRLVDLILVQPKACKTPRGSQAWVDALQPSRLFHVRHDNAEDVQRMARLLTGQSVGLVLSGGGARAYAHVGAIKALKERGVPIDFVGGVSMGAIVGAGLAVGWDGPEMDERIRDAFVTTSPLDDIALPLLAMTRGEKVRERLAKHFGDIQIADLWLPFFCVSSNLTTGAYQLHKGGLLREALRATISLPGVLPPATTSDNNVLVDGAVMKNFPADIMRLSQLGPIVGVDVSRGRSITADDVARPESVWRWIRSGQWRKGPPIVSLLMRAATVSTGRDLAAAREATDVLITPDLTGVEIRDWSAYAPAVEAGYRATIEALDKLTRPVTELRRRPDTEDEHELRAVTLT
ncbi:cyclic nucleotide-binding protein [Phenylobacterium sp. Root77]|uniref:patatin-like phospholipase family protein n=1 Tax=unclassified Phenylobacterium TaxID=2640670 RepID=UPI0007022C95|nr:MULTISPECIES: patatin-like phospholipase family protein [unclassified Phenylobacterium]KQW71341.1 cyclic nucleotide-binding protein [Phenylobacterium sp. Root1277]KQW94262.1 cyclic nucleotide-binding protein [Phenylobacterium sp. Root1290]KRC43955.1 cyclic nucleotide-binding protein [Phenylobacterium sp. Root77]